MTINRNTLALALAAGLSLACTSLSANAGGPRGSAGMNAATMNGVSLNGTKANGVSLNGTQTNLVQSIKEDVTFALEEVKLMKAPSGPGGQGGTNSATMNGVSVNGVSVNGVKPNPANTEATFFVDQVKLQKQ